MLYCRENLLSHAYLCVYTLAQSLFYCHYEE